MGGEEMNIRESGENYLEAILNIIERSGKCRSVDVAKELGFSKPSVLIMLGVPKDVAFKDACKIEHDLSSVTFDKIKEFYNKHKS